MVLRVFDLIMVLWDLTGQYLNLPQGGHFALPRAISYLRSIQLGLVLDLETMWT